MSDWTLSDAERAEMTELLASLIRIPSPDPPGNEAEIATFLVDWLRARGFAVEIDEFEPERINVLARIKSSGSKPGLVFSAHMDTMPIGDSTWKHDPFGAETKNGRLYGRGAGDMKSGLAAMAAAALKIKTAGLPLTGDLILAFSAGESSSCLGAKRMVEAGSLTGAGTLLVSEPSSLGLIVAETGALWLRVTATGKPGHASAGGGDNAVLKLIDFLHAVRDNPFKGHTHPLLGPASLAINTISGGTAVNLTADHAEATLDIRSVPGMTTPDILAELEGIAAGRVNFHIIDDKPPVVTETTDPFIAICRGAVEKVTGVRPEPSGAGYFSDSSTLVPALDLPRVIIGPGKLGMSGQGDEWVGLDDLSTAAAIYGEIAADLLAPD